MFHSNGLFTGFAPTLIAGGTMALRRKFSASGFVEDVRKFQATYFNYVGKPLTYILATQARADDADNTLKFVFGNEAADLDIARFSARFGVEVKDGYGSTETGAAISRTDDMPAGALGVAAEGTLVLDAETGSECPPAEFDAEGRLLNSEQAIGEIVNTGDQVMAALQMSDPEAFDASEFSRFLASQSDLGTKWTPRYVRLTVALPITHTSKVMKRELRAERWECDACGFTTPMFAASHRSRSFSSRHLTNPLYLDGCEFCSLLIPISPRYQKPDKRYPHATRSAGRPVRPEYHDQL